MEDNRENSDHLPEEILTKESPQLVAILKEMKDGLDVVRCKVQALTLKVKQNQFLTADGMSYLEAKHLLLLSYCQSIVYYLLRKAKGLSIEGHPVVRSLVEIRLFLEKIRPIDKKLEYQVQKLTRAASNVAPEKTVNVNGKDRDESQDEEDPSKHRPNPDNLIPKIPASEGGGGVYRPPMIVPTSMGEDKMSKQEKQDLRKQKESLRQTTQSSYVKDLIDDLEDRPEELSEYIGVESRELSRYRAKREEHARQEENLFTRVPVTKIDKKLEKHMRKSRDGLLGLTDGFYDEIRGLPLEEKENDNMTSYTNTSKGGKGFKKRKTGQAVRGVRARLKEVRRSKRGRQPQLFY